MVVIVNGKSCHTIVKSDGYCLNLLRFHSSTVFNQLLLLLLQLEATCICQPWKVGQKRAFFSVCQKCQSHLIFIEVPRGFAVLFGNILLYFSIFNDLPKK